LGKIVESGLVAIVRTNSSDLAARIAEACARGGAAAIEITFTVPGAAAVIEDLARKYASGEILIGAGTVLDPADVHAVFACNGRLIVAPNADLAVIAQAKVARLVALPGVMTPSEGFAALKAGADGLKLFPAEIIPPAVFKAWRAVFPAETLLLAVGGVGVDNLKSYAEAGASGYGIGSALYKPGRSAVEIGKLAKALVAAAKA
jgi:2-dehydro-3-deoxyphosphogalactonate aldolase